MTQTFICVIRDLWVIRKELRCRVPRGKYPCGYPTTIPSDPRSFADDTTEIVGEYGDFEQSGLFCNCICSIPSRFQSNPSQRGHGAPEEPPEFLWQFAELRHGTKAWIRCVFLSCLYTYAKDSMSAICAGF